MAIDGKTDLGRTFDLVHAREFYPFTRTADLNFQREYLEALARHVAPGGALALALLATSRSLAVNETALGHVLNRLGLTGFRSVILASPRLDGILPSFAARAATHRSSQLKGLPSVRFYVARRK